MSAVAALVLAIGAPTYDRYLFYKSGQPDDTVYMVGKGQALAFEHVSWKAAIEPTTGPAESRHNTPDKQWMKITVTRAALDDTGAVLTGTPTVTLVDSGERTWQTESLGSNLPTEKNPIGKEFTYTLRGVVPANVAGQVQVHLKPDITYRSDTPTEKLMEITPELQEKSKRNDVLVFRR